MGLMDSIGSGLGSITKALDVGSVVKGVVDKVLPQNLHFVGDVAGAVVDYETGNYIGAAKLGMQALQDLPQAAKGAQQHPGQPASGGTAGGKPAAPNPALDPSPPPLARDLKSFNWNDLLSAIKALTASLSGQGTKATADTTTKAAFDTKAKAAADAVKAAKSGTATGTNATPASASTSNAASTSSSPPTSTVSWIQQVVAGVRAEAAARHPASWEGHPTTPAPTTETQARSTTSSTAATSSAPAASATTQGTSASSATDKPAASTGAYKPAASATDKKSAADAATRAEASSSNDKGQTISSLSQMKGMSDAAFMDAVSNGRISPDVAKDPAAQMAIQQRMNDISQMNALMTAMMKAIHDMQMAVIQNIRV